MLSVVVHLINICREPGPHRLLIINLLLADHVCRSHWISAHMTNTFSLQLVTGTIYKTEPTVALGQTDLVSIKT